MKKIVINSCYGGFSLSFSAIRDYAQLCDTPVYFFTYSRETNQYTEVPDPDVFSNKIHALDVYTFLVRDPNEILKQFKNQYESIRLRDDDIARDDPNLVKVVENLGKDANGYCSKLKIVEIPDDVDWVIEEFDGLEWVAEKHRVWR